MRFYTGERLWFRTWLLIPKNIKTLVRSENRYCELHLIQPAACPGDYGRSLYRISFRCAVFRCYTLLSQPRLHACLRFAGLRNVFASDGYDRLYHTCAPHRLP